MALVLSNGAMMNLAGDAGVTWRPLIGAAVAVTGLHAIWETSRSRRIVAGPTGIHWSGGLLPSAGSVEWSAVRRIDARHQRFTSTWRLEVLDGPGRPRLVTLRGPGLWPDLRVRMPDRIIAWWREAGESVRESHFAWGWRLEREG